MAQTKPNRRMPAAVTVTRSIDQWSPTKSKCLERVSSRYVCKVRRVKKGSPSTHPHRGDELGALRRLARDQDPKSPFVFTSERGAPFTTVGFARMLERAGVAAELGFKAHPHMLCHACGFVPAKRGTIRERCRPT